MQEDRDIISNQQEDRWHKDSMDKEMADIVRSTDSSSIRVMDSSKAGNNHIKRNTDNIRSNNTDSRW